MSNSVHNQQASEKLTICQFHRKSFLRFSLLVRTRKCGARLCVVLAVLPLTHRCYGNCMCAEARCYHLHVTSECINILNWVVLVAVVVLFITYIY